MSASRFFDAVVAGTLILALVFTCVLYYFSGQEAAVETMAPTRDFPYENLFGRLQVMEIGIELSGDDWEDILSNPLAEEYKQCNVTVNGILYTDAAIRTKGNTSLSQVASIDSDRYSFKIEFDHYDKNKSMDGLDKLILNNLFCDATYVKEYIAYDIFRYAGVETPFYAFADITVNGEGFGCYIALEAMEDSFIERVYGGEGMLYKPESDMAGGGSGRGNRMDLPKDGKLEGGMEPPEGMELSGGMEPPEGMGLNEGMEPPEGRKLNGGIEPPEGMELSGGMEPPEGMGLNGGMELTEGSESGERMELPEGGELKEGIEFPDETGRLWDREMHGQGNRPEGGNRRFGERGTGGGSDLAYVDDNPDSYSDIFENASFDITDEDKQRVIMALQKLNEGEELEKYLDVDACLRYFAAQTFIVNLDSYYSNLKHNYYLYEKDGKLTMLPWDLNLAFGGFQSKDATEAVNGAIDTPMDGLEEDRPLFSELMKVEEYKEQYHNYLNEIVEGYVNSGQFSSTLSEVKSAIAPYVEKDATAFYSFREFTEAIEILEAFVLLRAESVEKQLTGEIPSESGKRDSDTVLVDAAAIRLSAMGTQNGGGADGPAFR